MKNLLILLCLITLTACSSMGKKETRTLNEVRCSGFLTWEACDAKARQVCSNGYDVVSKEESVIEQKRVLSYHCK